MAAVPEGVAGERRVRQRAAALISGARGGGRRQRGKIVSRNADSANRPDDAELRGHDARRRPRPGKCVNFYVVLIGTDEDDRDIGPTVPQSVAAG